MPIQQQIDPGILLISTGNYKQFVQPLLTQIDKYFLTEYHKKIFLFTDEWLPELESKSHIIQLRIPPLKYPYVTLYRFSFFSKYEDQLRYCSHLYYLDVDSAIVDVVGDEFLVEGLLAVRHPGFYNGGWGDSSNPIESTSYLPPEKRKHYFCGGCMGGNSSWFLGISKTLSDNIKKDEVNGIIAEWNDETHWNFILHTRNDNVTEFDPSYMMPEPEHLRKSWGISHLKPKILALDKNHLEIRS